MRNFDVLFSGMCGALTLARAVSDGAMRARMLPREGILHSLFLFVGLSKFFCAVR